MRILEPIVLEGTFIVRLEAGERGREANETGGGETGERWGGGREGRETGGGETGER